MQRRLLHSSSLALKFWEDFPDQDVMPLMLSEEPMKAYQRHVAPLLELSLAIPDLQACFQAVEGLIRTISDPSNGLAVYEAARSAAEYVQSSFALCLLEAAAYWSVKVPEMALHSAALASCDRTAYKELVQEDICRRFVANGLQRYATELQVVLYKYPTAVATDLPGHGSNWAVLPAGARYSLPAWGYTQQQQQQQQLQQQGLCCSQTAGDSTANCSSSTINSKCAVMHRPFAHVVQSALRSCQIPIAMATASPLGDGQAAILRKAVWKRRLAQVTSNYVPHLLGRDGPGTVVLSGPCLPCLIKGLSGPPATGSNTGSSGCAETTTSFTLSFVGYPDVSAAQEALIGCLTEVITRYFFRHPESDVTSQRRTAHPLAVLTQHQLWLLLPINTRTHLENPLASAMALLIYHVMQEATQRSDLCFCFDLTQHTSIEALLLAAPNCLSAFAYDGEDVYTLPSSLRALASGAVLLNPAAIAQGPSWFAGLSGGHTAAPVGATNSTAASRQEADKGSRAAAGINRHLSGISSNGKWRSSNGEEPSGLFTPERVSAAVAEVAAVATASWQPLLPVSTGVVAGATAAADMAGSWLGCLTSPGLALQLPSRITVARVMAPQQAAQAAAELLELIGAATQRQQLDGATATPVASLKPGSLHHQLLLADIGQLLVTIGSSSTLAALFDYWPMVAPAVAAYGSNEVGAAGAPAAVADVGAPQQQQQQQLAAGSRWWDHFMKLLLGTAASDASRCWTQQQQQQNMAALGYLDLQVGSSGQQGPRSSSSRQCMAWAVQDLPDLLLHSPVAQRLLLDQSQRQQQQQQKPSTHGAVGNVWDDARQQLLKLLQQQKWVWGKVLSSSQQQQQRRTGLALLPANVAQEVQARWWKGPIMHGPVLGGAVVQAHLPTQRE